MAEPTNAPLGSPLGGGPLGGSSYEDDEKAMRSGKGRMMAAMIFAVLASIGGVTWYVLQGDTVNTYSEYGRSVNGIHRDQWQKFWACALQSPQAYDRIANNTELKAALDLRAGRGGPRFGRLVRETCMPRLAEMHEKYATLLPPPDLAEKTRAVATAADALRNGWSEYIAFLDASGATYDPETSGPPIMKIARAWFDYKNAFNALNSELRKKIDGR
jgi:hypothetical protein